MRFEKFSRGINPGPLLTGAEKGRGGIKGFLHLKEGDGWKGQGEGEMEGKGKGGGKDQR